MRLLLLLLRSDKADCFDFSRQFTAICIAKTLKRKQVIYQNKNTQSDIEIMNSLCNCIPGKRPVSTADCIRKRSAIGSSV